MGALLVAPSDDLAAPFLEIVVALAEASMSTTTGVSHSTACSPLRTACQ